MESTKAEDMDKSDEMIRRNQQKVVAVPRRQALGEGEDCILTI